MTTKRLSDVMSQINTGDLLAFRVTRYRSFTSWALLGYQKATKAKYSHVGIAARAGNRLYIVEAVPPRVQITPITHLQDFYWLPIKTTATNDTMFDFLDFNVDKPYRLKDIVTHYIGMDKDDSSVYCSELASRFYYWIGYLNERESGHTPDKIVNAVLARSGEERPIFITIDKGNIYKGIL